VRLESCQFVDADLDGWFTLSADLDDCRFSGRLSGVVFNRRDDTGRGRTTSSATTSVRLTSTTLPFATSTSMRSSSHKAPSTSACATSKDASRWCAKEVKTWPQEAACADAEEMLRLIESVFEDEPDVFTKRSFLLEMADSPEVGERLLELLEHSS
jgi:hypothetical protein